MIDKDKIIETVKGRLKNLPLGHYLDLRTYKRNRSVMIIRESKEDLKVIQNGYEQEIYKISTDKLPKLLKTLLKKEFPRSNKVRLYTMGKFDEAASQIRRKIL